MTIGRSLSVLAVAAVFSASAQAAEAPAALVLDYSGPANAKLSAFSELPDGTEVTLGARDKLTILHYRSCKQVSITGAKVSVTVPRLTVTGGTQSEEPGEQCPQEVKVATAGVSGGVLMRSVAVFTVAPRLDCVVVGGRKAEIGSVEVLEAGKEVLSIPVQGHRAIAAPGAPELNVGSEYSLVVKAIGGAEIKAIPVTVLEEASGKTCLLRVD